MTEILNPSILNIFVIISFYIIIIIVKSAIVWFEQLLQYQRQQSVAAVRIQ